MDGVISRVILGLIRHLVGIFFAGWTAKEWMTGDQQTAAVTAVMTLVPILFSVYDKMQKKDPKQ